MKPIKFSHWYPKLPEGRIATLLQVFVVDYKDLSDAFKAYDTKYALPAIQVNYYELPKGKLLVLLLQADKVFTTIRRWTPEKERYYKSHEGNEFKLEVEGE